MRRDGSARPALPTPSAAITLAMKAATGLSQAKHLTSVVQAVLVILAIRAFKSLLLP
jgi:hypothetical protein